MATSMSEAPTDASTLHQLAVEHASLEARLAQLHQLRFLRPEEEFEAACLKKRKLLLKDSMRQLQT